jgi:hypothetical protein
VPSQNLSLPNVCFGQLRSTVPCLFSCIPHITFLFLRRVLVATVLSAHPRDTADMAVAAGEKEMRDTTSIEASSQQTPPDTEHDSREVVNASGHVQELSRHFSLLSLAGVGLVVGNVWPAIGGSILVALYNGGPPGNTPPGAGSLTALTRYRCFVRIHRRLRLLLDCRGMYSRAGICYSFFRRRVSVGISHPRSQMGPRRWLFRWLLELACLGVWRSLNDADLCE